MGWSFSLDELKLEPFNITVNVNGKDFQMIVAQGYLSAQLERFTVKGKGENSREIILQSDRPILRLKEAKKGISWKVHKGQEIVIKNPQAFEEILREIERHIKDKEKQ